MLLKGHACTNVARHLGFEDSWGTVNTARIEQSLPFQVFDRTSHRIKLTPEGLEYAKKCVKALEILVPNYTEPKKRIHKTSPIF
jgi:hypothetical protein